MKPATTRTGGFAIGFRRGWSEWQKDEAALVEFARAEGFACVDVAPEAFALADALTAAGLAVGTVDLPAWKDLFSPLAEERQAAVQLCTAHLEKWAAYGPRNHFLVLLPKDPSKPRSENFAYIAESLAALSPALEANQAKLVIEGWPGPGALGCTPDSLRGLFARCPSPAIGINYDPSHLIRMGIDAVRFAREFAPRIYHVHGKDTELFPDAFYDYGHELRSEHGGGHDFGAHTWRYTIPGHGVMAWPTAFRILADAGYQGAVTIELEDQHFNGSTEGEQTGLRLSRDFLAGC